MRLSINQQTAIRAASIAAFDAGVSVWLFGSRVDDNKRGGDIDLLIQPAPAATSDLFSRKIRFLTRLERELGERKIDVVIEVPHDTRPIVEVARATGVKLV
ncbi:nucleotidyltransferase domain-containing protein [Rhodoferax antarcticus]|uniref:Uncharacterized protein n=1 Tax=Rhodoferax antarcticus ANT.BR TaxID=1111071 RepID=A0A1Q8YEC3_9BURK|nr:nucleotidyltransferase domain-containing protein [Rhodoferax antarcticus]APW46136.1 DNA polymerase beta [Rhodoferax antarcticus]MCW2310287.1 putative nucleotidyltransferase [Rhodoferax antarcticus]OLP06315.1 hypothetical protein BLL52_2546 [Rhodoferax antarcticus ANT.BR]